MGTERERIERMDTALKERPAPAAREAVEEQFVTVEGRALARVMPLMAAIVTRKSKYPILARVKITVARKAMKISVTDLDIEAIADVDMIDGAGEWSRCVDCQMLATISRLAGPMKMRLSLADHGMLAITLGDGDASYRIFALDADGFPSLAGERGDVIERFTNGMLGTILPKASSCISTDETRYYLNGLAWQIGESGRRLVSCDGHRMALCQYQGASMGTLLTTRIIARKMVGLLQRFCGSGDIAFHQVDGREMIDAVLPGLSIRSKLIDGAYPDVDRVIPKERKFRFEFKRLELVAALARVAIFASRFGSRAVKVSNRDGRVALDCHRVEYGEASCTLSTVWPEGKDPPAEFGFNAEYFDGLVASCQGDVVMHHTGDGSSALVITDEDDTMTRVLMPVRV
jgi:DNA polymerase-3 subunit beta